MKVFNMVCIPQRTDIVEGNQYNEGVNKEMEIIIHLPTCDGWNLIFSQYRRTKIVGEIQNYKIEILKIRL